MQKYCFEITQTKTVKAIVRVNADSFDEAAEILEKAYADNKIKFDDDEDIDYDYEINSDFSNEDDTFDDKQFSDENLQLFE